MKTITRLCGFAFLGFIGFTTQATAQITITTADMPYAGLNVVTATDSTSGYLPGSASASTQNWNFSALNKQKTAKIIFMAPSSTKYSSVFPLANLADSTVGGNGYNFFINNVTEFAVGGSEEIINYSGYVFQVELNLAPVFVQSNLSATYNDKANGVSRGSEKLAQTVIIYDSEKVATNITYFDTIDAYGTMTTPKGTFNVLRQNHHEVDIDSITMRNSISGTWGPPPSGTGITSTAYHQYNWYTNGTGYILVQMNMNTSTGAVSNVVWDTTAVVLGINELSHNNSVSFYPNPCSTQITFQSTGGNGEQFIHVYDMAGRQLEQVAMKNGMSTLNTSAYASGMYLFTLADKTGNIIDRGKFTVK